MQQSFLFLCLMQLLGAPMSCSTQTGTTQICHCRSSQEGSLLCPLSLRLSAQSLNVGSTAQDGLSVFIVLFAYQSMDRPASATVTPAATAVLPAPLTVGVGTCGCCSRRRSFDVECDRGFSAAA